MALVNGTNYDHIDLHAASGGDVTRHKLQDTDGRAMVAPTEASSTASAAHPAGSYFIYNNKLYQATADIASGGTITPNTNCKEAPLGGQLSDLKSAISAIEDEVYEEVEATVHTEIIASQTIPKRTINNDGSISSNDYANNIISSYTINESVKQISVSNFPTKSGTSAVNCAFYSVDAIADCSASNCLQVTTYTLGSTETLLDVPEGAKLFVLKWYNTNGDIGDVYITRQMVEASRIDRIENTMDEYGEPEYYAAVEKNTELTAISSTSGRYIGANGAISVTSNTHSIGSVFNIVGALDLCFSGFPLQSGTPQRGQVAFYSAESSLGTSNWLGTKGFDLGNYETYIPVPDGAKTCYVRWYDELGSIGNVTLVYKKELKPKLDDFTLDCYLYDQTFTVGASGADFTTLNAAIQAASKKYPVYRKGGIAVNVLIKSGTVINEQIAVVGMDLSYITITSEDDEVGVNLDGFNDQGLDEHDLRGPNVGAFIGGENGAGLPKIGTKFKVVQNTNSLAVVGYFANRSSKGVVLSGCGFDGFNDGCISNNESSITIREGIARNNARYGVHARHNGEVSARSCNCSGNGEIGAYADRVANLDVRMANLNGCATAIAGYNASTICAVGATAENCGTVVKSQSLSTVDCNGMSITDPTNTNVAIFNVEKGGMISCFDASITNTNNVDVTNIDKNTLDQNGIIWG